MISASVSQFRDLAVIVKFLPMVRLQLYQSSSHLLSDSILVGGAPRSPRHSQVTSARGKASTLHSSCTRRPGLADTFCTGTWTSGRTAERARLKYFSDTFHISGVGLTLDVQLEPPADGGRVAVAGDAEVAPRLAPPHLLQLQHRALHAVHCNTSSGHVCRVCQ